MLETLGLDTVAEAVYRSVLDNPAADMAELCAQAGVDEAGVRAALDRLAALRLLRTRGSGDGIGDPVDPGISLGALLARRRSELAEHQQRLDDARTVVDALAAGYRDGRTCGVIERLDTLEEVRDRLVELAAGAQGEILSFMAFAAMSDAHEEHATPLDRALLERGVIMRDVRLDATRNDAVASRYVASLLSLGAQARTVPTVPIPMVVLDREKALIPLDPEELGGGAYVLHGKGLARTMAAFFEAVWRTATPWGAPVPVDPNGLSPVERGVLALLAEGFTDEQTARRLQLSSRTVRRISAELMTRLGARSRFDAGVRAAKAGWL